MNALILLGLVTVFATANASLLGLGGLLVAPGAPGAVIQGPSAQAALTGPDGSAIAATAVGGAVATAPALAAPAIAAPTVIAGPSGTVSITSMKKIAFPLHHGGELEPSELKYICTYFFHQRVSPGFHMKSALASLL